MAWWDTLYSGAQTVAGGLSSANNLYNSFYNAVGGGQQGGLLNLAGSLYNQNQNSGAIDKAVGAITNAGQQNINTLGQVYNQGMQMVAPYQQAGTQAVGQYQNLLQNPSQITQDPGYQFRVNQGNEAVTRNAASKRMLGSGNFATALSDYGQGTATAELDSALNRRVPLMNAGLSGLSTAANLGQNYAVGSGLTNMAMAEAIAGGALGQAGTQTNLLRDLLVPNGGQQGQQQGGGSGSVQNIPSTENPVGNYLSSLFGGNAAASAGAANGVGAVGAGNFGAGLGAAGLGGAGLSAAAGGGATGAAALGGGGFGAGLGASGLGGAGLSGAGAGGISGMGGSAAAFEGMSAGIGSQVGGAAAGSAGGSGTGAAYGAGWLAAPAIMVAALKYLDSVNWGKGGASESAKLGKMQSEITGRLQSDPSGNSAKQFIDSIITNKQWPGELNQDELGTLFDSGMIGLDNTPTLHSGESIVDLWNYDLSKDVYNPANDPDSSHSTRHGAASRYLSNPQVRSQYIGPQAIAATYGLTREQQQQYESLIAAERQAKSNLDSDDGSRSLRRGDPRTTYNSAKSALDQFKSNYLTEPRKRMYASALYDNLRSTGYQGDLTKLERYLGVA